MHVITKSALLRDISQAFDEQDNLDVEFLIKGKNTIVKFSLEFKEREVYIDENGTRWVKE